MEKGRLLEQKLKEEQAIDKYKEVILIQPSNLKAYTKLVELNCAAGARQTDTATRSKYYKQAKAYADAALRLDSSGADANYMMAVVYDRIAQSEIKKEKFADEMKLMRDYAAKAIAANPAMGKAYGILGKWHLEVLTLNPVKKAAVKVLYYSRLDEANIDTAIAYMEKCKTLEPYYCPNFLHLGEAYDYHKLYEKAIAVLQQLAKLPTKRQEDVDVKAEGAVLLQKLQ